MSGNQDFVIENGVLTKYHGPGGDVTIPAGVTEIEWSAFWGCTGLTSVTIPAGVTEIGWQAFYDRTGLTSVTIPEGVTKIGDSAFWGCTGLTSVTIPEGVTKIENSTFWGCTGLTSVTIPEGVTKIGDSAFYNCTGLTSVTIPESVTEIGDSAFSGCTGLTSVTIPEGVTKIGGGTFQGCTGLTSVTIPESVTEIGGWAFQGCTGLTSVTIPEGVTKIGDSAFQGCTGLTSVTIPEGVTKIGDSAFWGCTGLTSVTIPAGVTEIGDSAFQGCPKLADEKGLVVLRGICLDYTGPGGDVTIPASVTNIGVRAFQDCTGLTSVTIPAGVTKIGDSAFQGCTGLTSMTIPAGVTKIGGYAFEGCANLTSVTIPAGVTEIGDSAFQGCTGLTSVTIPESVTEIGGWAFQGCTGLTSVTIPEGVTEIGGSAFDGCTKLTRVVLPRSIRKIDVGYAGEKRYKTMPEGLFQTADKLDNGFVEQISEVWSEQLTPRDWACLYLFQMAKVFQELCKNHMKKVPAGECLSAMLELLAGCKKGSAYVQAANFVVEHLKKVQPEQIQALYEMAAAKKSFQKAADILKPLVSTKKKKTAGSGGPFAFLEDTFQETLLLKHYKEQEGVEKLLESVKLADGEKAPALAVLAAVVPYADLYIKPTQVNGYEETEVRFLSESDKAAALLDHDSLMELLWANVKALGSPSWLLPYCRFANGKELQSLLSASKGRDAQKLLGRYALMLSDTREAMLYLDKLGGLDSYARLRGTDADTLWDTVLAEFGLDKEGKKVYDLGDNTVTVTLAQDLTLSIFDANAGKEVKSIPKKGAGPEQYEAAKADFAEMKKNVKKVAKSRRNLLFQYFLSGKTWKANDWKSSYAGDNFLLRQVASLLVWNQSGKTFTLRDGAAIDSVEQPYTISSKSIQVAHPMEMKPEDVAAWQRYFNDHAIKQPFAQVWEPVMAPETVKEDRYSGIRIPAYRFKGQEKHGISFDFSYSTSELELSFSDCFLDYDPYGEGGAVGRHMLNLDGLVTLGKLTFDTYTRQVNHIVSLLDKWTILGRIMKDDVSVVTMLDSATLAQVMEYLNLAIDNGKTNVTAELLNYKNERFPDFDPLAEFTLDDL